VDSVPLRDQKAEILVESALNLERVEIVVDGEKVASFDRPPYRFLWPLKEGKHRVQAVGFLEGKMLQTEVVEFEVIPPLPQKP
jgi:hypothetical protein